MIDPGKRIFDPAQVDLINPQVIITTCQKEQSAVTKPCNDPTVHLAWLMGYGTPSTARAQIFDATHQFRRDLDLLYGGNPTPGGWQINVSKLSQDGLLVTPKTFAVAVLFSYTPYVGAGWGGSFGGNCLFNQIYSDWGFYVPPPPDGCVQAGTLLDTPSGPRAIETFKVGDSIMGHDQQGCPVTATITRVLIHDGTWTLYQVQDVWLTPEHEVFIQGKWQRADAVSQKTQRFTGKVYDLTTTTGNFLSAQRLLIHNKKEEGPRQKIPPPEPQ
jgi:hypothetical protein